MRYTIVYSSSKGIVIAETFMLTYVMFSRLSNGMRRLALPSKYLLLLLLLLLHGREGKRRRSERHKLRVRTYTRGDRRR